MSKVLFVAFALCIAALGNSIPITISRYGGNSGRRQRREMYALEERRRSNTCCLARLLNQNIKLGKCPSIENEYKKLFERRSVSFLDDYYRHRCDVVDIVEIKPDYFCAFLGASCMTLASLFSLGCAVGLVKEIFSNIIIFF
jgi:hypothetical protein